MIDALSALLEKSFISASCFCWCRAPVPARGVRTHRAPRAAKQHPREVVRGQPDLHTVPVGIGIQLNVLNFNSSCWWVQASDGTRCFVDPKGWKPCLVPTGRVVWLYLLEQRGWLCSASAACLNSPASCPLFCFPVWSNFASLCWRKEPHQLGSDAPRGGWCHRILPLLTSGGKKNNVPCTQEGKKGKNIFCLFSVAREPPRF